MQLFSQSPVNQTTKPLNPKTASTVASGSGVFSKVLDTVSTEIQAVSEKQPSDILEKLQEVFNALQELPKEELSPKEQEIVSALMQLLTLQLQQVENTPQGTNFSPEKVNMNHLGQEMVVITNTSQEKSTTPNQEKLMTLLHQVDQELQESSNVTTSISKPFVDIQELLGVDGKKVLADPLKVEQVLKQIATFIQQLESEQIATGTQTSFPQLEQLKQVLNKMNSLSQEQINLTELTEMKQIDGKNADIPRTVLVNTNINTNTTPDTVYQQQDGGEFLLEPLQGETTDQPLAATSAQDTAKANQVAGRPEVNAPTPTVRMSNLVEDLGEVLQNSIRLSGTKEGTQIKVSIFPEHLGHLEIRLTETNGKIAAQIFTSSLVAKEVLDQQVNHLRNTLLQQGVTIDKIEIAQQTSQQSFGQQNAHPEQRFTQQQQKGTLSRDKNGYQRIEEEVAATERNPSEVGLMKVDYTV